MGCDRQTRLDELIPRGDDHESRLTTDADGGQAGGCDDGDFGGEGAPARSIGTPGRLSEPRAL